MSQQSGCLIGDVQAETESNQESVQARAVGAQERDLCLKSRAEVVALGRIRAESSRIQHAAH